MISIAEALDLIARTVLPVGTETIRLSTASGRILADSVFADVDSPPHTKSVMDGYAVRSEDVSKQAPLRIVETIFAGENPAQPISAGMAARIMTGAPLPDGADSVVMIEQSNEFEQDGVRFVRLEIDALEPGRHTMRQGAAFSAGEAMFAAQHQIRPIDIGLLAEVGAATVNVYRRPTAAVLPTGNELVDPAVVPNAGQIRNSNGPMLAAQLTSAGMLVTNLGIGRDDPLELRDHIQTGLQNDLLVLSGGVSMGMLDLVPEVLQEMGVTKVFHKVNVKPGKTIWFGVYTRQRDRKYVFGLPGNPVSSLVGFELLVKAAISRMNGYSRIQAQTMGAELAESHQARGDRPTYWPGCWVDYERMIRRVMPLSWLGSSDLRPLGQANVLIFFPGHKENYDVGERVDVVPIG